MPTPAYRDLADRLADRIRAGEYPIGENLPSIAKLVEAGSTLGVARDALIWLVEQGWAEARQGKGYAVVRIPPEPPGAPEPDWLEWRQSVEERLAVLEGKTRDAPTDNR